MATCFLFTQHLREEGCLSLKLDQRGQVEAPLAQRSFAEIKSMQVNTQTYIVTSAQRFSFHKLHLPWLADKKARAAIPFALEDKLAQNFDTLHFAFDSNHYHNGNYLVIVADKNYLRELIATFDSQAINFDLLTIDWFALKPDELALLEFSILVNDESYQGALSADLIPFYLEKRKGELAVYSFTDSNKEQLNLPLAEATEIPETSFIWLAQRLQTTRPMQLCQGDLQHGNSQSKTKQLYLAAIGMCLIWLLSVLTTNAIKIHNLNKDTSAVDGKIAVIYREFFPQATQIINPKFRISQLVKTNQSTADSTFWMLLDKLAKTIQANSVNVEQIRYQNQTITITLATKNFSSLENLQTKLQQNKVKVKQTQASTKDGQVVGVLELSL
ncbi:MAG: general secretion pathway protein GspL [Tatlockia sp.]|nr:general secretion pathway protein GspL [Tatlockia sp.]